MSLLVTGVMQHACVSMHGSAEVVPAFTWKNCRNYKWHHWWEEYRCTLMVRLHNRLSNAIHVSINLGFSNQEDYKNFKILLYWVCIMGVMQLKHEKAVIRRKGQVREIRAPTGNYGGESTGIRTNLSRSVRFNHWVLACLLCCITVYTMSLH